MKPISPKQVSTKECQKIALAFAAGKRKVAEVKVKSREPVKGFLYRIRNGLTSIGKYAGNAVNIILAVMKDGWHAYIITARGKPSFAAVSVIPPAFIAGIAFEQRNLRTAFYGITLYMFLTVFLMYISGAGGEADVQIDPKHDSTAQEELEADIEEIIPHADEDLTPTFDSGNERIGTISDEDSWETT